MIPVTACYPPRLYHPTALRLSPITLVMDQSEVEAGAAACRTWITATPSAVEVVREMDGGTVTVNETAKGTEIVIGNA